jgi:hypothetical protein
MPGKEIFKAYKGWIITAVVSGTLGFVTYITTLIIQDTDWYKQEQELIEWYDGKSHSFAVGLRVEIEYDSEGKEKHRIVYKAPDGEKYKAVYSKKGKYYYYLDAEGELQECH